MFADILWQHLNTNPGKDIFIEQVTLTSAPQTTERWIALRVHHQSHLKAHPNMGWVHLLIQSSVVTSGEITYPFVSDN